MSNPFATEDAAAGYANARPPVHQRVIDEVYRALDRSEPFDLALDVGCGAGLSTKALAGIARVCIGLEPAETMLRWSSAITPSARFLAASAEAIPIRDHAVGLITAAGSLNYVDLDRFFPEALRILAPCGVLVVYDFSAGNRFSAAPGLGEWFAAFRERYPPPLREARELNPSILARLDSGFRVHRQRELDIAITLSLEFYLDYLLTEANVMAALRRGAPRSEIRSWCAETLGPVWGGADREVVFPGYFACMVPKGSF